MKRAFDLVFVGAGLSAGLAALSLKKRRPNLRVALLEEGSLEGRTSPTWSFHQSDLSPQGWEMVQPFLRACWENYEVAFPQYRRTLSSRYCSIGAEQFYSYLKKECGASIFENQRVVEWGAGQVRTAGGELWTARHVFDARGWSKGNWKRGEAGFQKFCGLDLELEAPHGVTAPLVMDACVPQVDGYRFFYLLPWSENHILVEDTRYTLDCEWDEMAAIDGVLAYAERRGWKVAKITRREKGCLLIPLGPERAEVGEGALPWGARAGLFHPTTGYSFLFAMEMALWLGLDPLDAGLSERFEEKRSALGRKLAFFRWINRMLFWQQPSERYRLLQRFYRLPEGTIARFYSTRLRVQDYLQILSGKPPIPTVKAFGVLSEKKRVQFSHVC